MPPTLASLVQHTSLKLTVLAGEHRLDAPVRWVHASELADPVPYMEGGELLLITAMKLDAEDLDAMRRYVQRLVGAGVVGLGFAAGVYYDQAPAALVEAAREAELPLLEVPQRTPFIAISKAVSAAIAADQYRAVTAGFDAQRELTRAALSPEGPAALLSRLAAHVDGWAALYDVSGAVLAVAPSWAARRANRLTPEVERLCDRAAPATAVVSTAAADGSRGTGDDRVELQSIGTARRIRAVLAVGTAAPLGTAERYAVHSAVALLTLTTERSRTLQEAAARLDAAVLRMLMSGQADHARVVAGRLYGGLLDAPLRVLVAESVTATTGRTPRPGGRAGTGPAPGPGTDHAPATAERGSADRGAAPGGPPGPGGPSSDTDPLGLLCDAAETAAARAGESVLAVPYGERLVVLAADGGAAAAACLRHARAMAEDGAGVVAGGLIVGMSAPAGPSVVATAYKQAEQALSVARRRGRAVVEHDEVATGSVLPLLADDAVRAFADGMLRALREHDSRGRGDLVQSLRAWLARHGQWDAAAADLGVHRHTLRYRMRRVEEILGRSLDDPDVRMELWLALKVTASGAVTDGGRGPE